MGTTRYDELGPDLQQAVRRLINTMASIRSDEFHVAKVNDLRQQVTRRWMRAKQVPDEWPVQPDPDGNATRR